MEMLIMLLQLFAVVVFAPIAVGMLVQMIRNLFKNEDDLG